MKVEVPLGDVVDRVTILSIKAARLKSAEALANVERELTALRDAWGEEGLPPMDSLPEWLRLSEVNLALWNVEDDLRALEAKAEFGSTFVAKARSVYRLNDARAALKRAINESLGSTLIEEKSYPAYAETP